MSTSHPAKRPGRACLKNRPPRRQTGNPTAPDPISKSGRENLMFMRFPFDNFTYYLTLFSKFFSSFPHGTCSLSVSRHYLALDEIYHPICAAFPNNATLRARITEMRELWPETGFSPSMIPYSKGFNPKSHRKTCL